MITQLVMGSESLEVSEAGQNTAMAIATRVEMARTASKSNDQLFAFNPAIHSAEEKGIAA
jgi:hypothetical protein